MHNRNTTTNTANVSRDAMCVAEIAWTSIEDAQNDPNFRGAADWITRSANMLHGASLYAPAESDDEVFLMWAAQAAHHLASAASTREITARRTAA